jgi:hypothetical protein
MGFLVDCFLVGAFLPPEVFFLPPEVFFLPPEVFFELVGAGGFFLIS